MSWAGGDRCCQRTMPENSQTSTGSRRSLRTADPFWPPQKEATPAEAPHVRSYFPEALYINPEIITDANGNASISIPIADSITTWRMAMLASTQRGALGSGTSSLKVFQDFFVDLDLPVTLTQGDRVSIPVAVYNYSGKRGEVSLSFNPKIGSRSTTIPRKEPRRRIRPRRRLAVHIQRQAHRQIQAHPLRPHERPPTADIVVREIEVVPNGREQNLVFNGRLEGAVRARSQLSPRNSIPDATRIFVRLYPGPLSQVIEGMDSILSMPGGCFEQTSSSTYPNVLALDYMKRTKKLTPEVHAKAEGYIANGYQRLLTFEVPGGGFSWFGQAPANKILTAYGLMEFNDMSKVSDVDPRLIERTRGWLAQPTAARRKLEAGHFLHQRRRDRPLQLGRAAHYCIHRMVAGQYRLSGAGGRESKALYRSRTPTTTPTPTRWRSSRTSPPTTAKTATSRANRCSPARRPHRKGRPGLWTADETGVYSTGSSAAIETTVSPPRRCLKWGQASETVAQSADLHLLEEGRLRHMGHDAGHHHGAARSPASQIGTADVRGTVHVLLNGKPVETLKLTPENNDLLHQFVFKGIDAEDTTSSSSNSKAPAALPIRSWAATSLRGRKSAPPKRSHRRRLRPHQARAERYRHGYRTFRNNLPRPPTWSWSILAFRPASTCSAKTCKHSRRRPREDRAPGEIQPYRTQAILYFNALAPRRNRHPALPPAR